jgi:hypothetical protein
MRAGVWNACVLLRELRERNYRGGYTILKDWLQPQRKATRTVAEQGGRANDPTIHSSVAYLPRC